MKRASLLSWCCCVLLSLSACTGDEGGGTPDSGTPDSGTPDSGTVDTTVTVSGKVVGPNGKPLANAAVLIQGRPPVTSDASGAFSIPGVTPPYDIVAVSEGRQDAIVYQGVTHRSPTLSISSLALPSFDATLTGSVLGMQTPSATVSEPEVVFLSQEGAGESATFAPGFSTYSLNVSWSGSPTTTGSLFAFQGERASPSDAVYTRFTGFGRRDNVSLSSGATVSNQDVTLSSVANSTLAGTLRVPAGFPIINNAVALRFAPGLDVPLFSQPNPGSSFSYTVPVVAQTTFTVTAFAATTGFESSALTLKTGVAAGTHNLNLELMDPPSPAMPLNNATNVTRTSEFTWRANPSGVHIVVFEKDTSSGGTPYNLSVVTRATRTTLPDLSALGMALPASTTLKWRVQGFSPLASVDGLLSGLDETSGLPAGMTEFQVSVAGEREFTTSTTP